MEGSESEKVFVSLNLNPQLFVHEVLNAVDDVIDGGFEFYEQQALELLGDMGEDSRNELSQCIIPVRNTIQEVLDKRLDVWEKYCLRHCFAVPDGFSSPNPDKEGDIAMDDDALSGPELDNQLDSLREKVSLVEKESAELHKEVNAMRKQSLLSSSYAMSVGDALKQYEHNSAHDMYQEIVQTASKLKVELENLKMKRRAELERVRTERIYDLGKDKHYIEGMPFVHLKGVEEFVADLRNM